MKIRCYKCNGAGKTKDPIDWFFGVATFGLGLLTQMDEYTECDACNGEGYLEENITSIIYNIY
jgi:DnaJ-class molecular chaperone